MTKKHFEAIAHVLDANEADISLVLDFADMLEETNPRFNRALFVQASTENLGKNARAMVASLDKARQGR